MRKKKAQKTIQTNLRLSPETRQKIADLRRIKGIGSDAEVVALAVDELKKAELTKMVNASLDMFSINKGGKLGRH